MFQHFFAMSALGLSVENSYLIAIAVLACVLGAEIAGICILIAKMTRAKQEYLLRRDEESDDPSDMGHFSAIAFLGAVPILSQISLLVLAIATAVAAVIFLLLLLVFRARGYSFESAHAPKASDAVGISQNTAEESAENTATQPLPVVAAEAEATTEEEPFFEEPVQNIFSAFDEQASEEATDSDGATVDSTEEASFDVREEIVPEEAVAVIPKEAPATPVAPASIPVYNSAYPGGQIPVIEKHITETVREVIRETTTTNTVPNQNGGYSPATEEILKAIAELMKLGTQIRMEKSLPVENPMVKDEVITPANTDADVEEELDVDEDELDAEDEVDNDTDVEDGAESDNDADDDDYESELFSGKGRIVGFDDETGCYIMAHYRKSFEAKLIQARPNVKKYYTEIKNALLSYENTRDRITWNGNSFQNERTPVAKINVRARALELYLALDPATLEDSIYHGKDVSAKKKYADTPYLYKVNSPRKLTLALELVQRTCEEQGLSPIDIEIVNYEELYPFRSTEDLVRRGLIREYLREEKPAVTFELDPDHEPELPEEDGSVIPANANFTWEFDNESESADEPEIEETPIEETPIEETVEEPVEEVASEPIVESIAQAPLYGSTTTTHETIKTTERHYTERYFGNGQPISTYEMISESAPANALEAPQETVTLESEESVETVEPTPTFAEEPVEELQEELFEELYDETSDEAADEELTWESYDEESEEVYEEEPEEAYDEESEEVYDEESEEVYDEESEEAYEEEPEEVYDEESEEVYEEEPEEVYEEESEEVYDEESEEVYDEESEEVYEEVYDEESEEVYDEIIEEPEEEVYGNESEDLYEEESDDLYEEESEALYEDESEEVYEEESDEESAVPAVTTSVSTDSSVALLDVCLFDDHFENGAIVNLETLKQVGLVSESAKTLKVYASGELKGQFTVEANHFTLDAIKAISAADGDSIMIR